jgi:hypothetical protein
MIYVFPYLPHIPFFLMQRITACANCFYKGVVC